MCIDGGLMNYIEEINRLKKEKNALILAHFYQTGDIQDVADFVGDSLALARIGAEAKEDIIVLCGVRFMAETAKILSPEKAVLLPNEEAGCPMADMVTADALATYKEENPDTFVVSYVNTNADVKALSDICVTSSNGLNIVEAIDQNKILFLPDRNLGGYIKNQTSHEGMDMWPGYCCVHHNIRPFMVKDKMSDYPDALVLVHPECRDDVVELGDYVGSTKGIIDFVNQSDHKEFIIVTEEGILHPLAQQNPDKTFILAADELLCQNMKKLTMEQLYFCLKDETGHVELDEEIIEASNRPLKKMLELS